MRWKKRLRINRETNIKLHAAFGLEIPHTDINSLYFGKLFPYSHTTGRKNSRGDMKRFAQEHGQAAENPGLEVQILWPKSSVSPTKLNCFPLKPWSPFFIIFPEGQHFHQAALKVSWLMKNHLEKGQRNLVQVTFILTPCPGPQNDAIHQRQWSKICPQIFLVPFPSTLPSGMGALEQVQGPIS